MGNYPHDSRGGNQLQDSRVGNYPHDSITPYLRPCPDSASFKEGVGVLHCNDLCYFVQIKNKDNCNESFKDNARSSK